MLYFVHALQKERIDNTTLRKNNISVVSFLQCLADPRRARMSKDVIFHVKVSNQRDSFKLLI